MTAKKKPEGTVPPATAKTDTTTPAASASTAPAAPASTTPPAAPAVKVEAAGDPPSPGDLPPSEGASAAASGPTSHDEAGTDTAMPTTETKELERPTELPAGADRSSAVESIVVLDTTARVDAPVEPERPAGEEAPVKEEVGFSDADLLEMGLPVIGTLLVCLAFEGGKRAEGYVFQISDSLDVAHVWLRDVGWRWPIPLLRIEGTTWTHDPDDYPLPGTVPAFDGTHRTKGEPPKGCPWELPLEAAPPPPVAVAPPRLAPGEFEVPTSTPAARVDAPVEPVVIPAHYIRCKVKGPGMIAGHGYRAHDGKVMEGFEVGADAYFTPATVAKLGHMLERVDKKA